MACVGIIFAIYCYFDSLAYRLQDAEVAISSVSQHWSQQRQALSSELRRQMRTRHSPIVDQVPIALDDVVRRRPAAANLHCHNK
jgi:uncharacterized protein YbaR (Trm112 family)